jgi:hypothetical protein
VADVPKLLRWSFAALVVGCAVLAGLVGLLAHRPSDVPGYALDSAAVWRTEVVVAVFVGPYLLLLATYLATQGRGFTKLIGPGGIGIEANELSLIETSQQELVLANETLHAALVSALIAAGVPAADPDVEG